MILTQNEDQQISGRLDSRIKVWRVDFINNPLTFLYSLQKHNRDVILLKLKLIRKTIGFMWNKWFNYNLVKRCKLQVVFQQVVKVINWKKLGIMLNLKEDQFIWVSSIRNILCIFEHNDTQYQKRVQFTKVNQGYLNQFLFPITLIKDKNLIFLRHQLHILLIKEQNDGQLAIVQELDWQDWEIYGTVTISGQNLIFWG